LSKEPVQNLLSALAGLQRRVDKADAIVEQKEEENTELREQLRQSERKRIEYETKMKSMEEAWQKQMASLQVSFQFRLQTNIQFLTYACYCNGSWM